MREIPLVTMGLITMVDDADYEWASQFKWYPKLGRYGCYYAHRSVRIIRPDGTVRKTSRQLQRDLFDPDATMSRLIKVDHRDGHTLNNVRSNLRLSNDSNSNCSRRLFKNNRLGIKGIRLESSGGIDTYFIRVKKDGRVYYGKCQHNVIDAIHEYNTLALRIQGEFARLNPPPAPIEC